MTARNEAVASFGTSLGYQVLTSGMIADEFTMTQTGSTLSLADQRRVSQQVQDYPYAKLSQTRVWGLEALYLLQRYAADSSAQIAQLFALLGYTEVLLSEDMCSGVPTAAVTNGQAANGSNLTRVQLLSLGMTYFDSALKYAGNNDSVATLARIGEARAMLDSGDFNSAAAAVSSVSTGYVYPIQFDSAVQYFNPVYLEVDLGAAGGASVSDIEGGVGIDFISGQDPRSATDSLGQGIWGPHIYESLSAPMVLASGLEARLIGAEGHLRSGNVVSWATTLNQLRETAIQPGLPDLPADSTTGASSSLQTAVMFRERALWLFATGHRQGDLRRQVRQYGLAENAVFPSGLYRGGPQTYGGDVTYVPYGENFNPEYQGCSDRSP